MTRTTLLLITLLSFTLALTASPYPGADSYYPGGGSSSGGYPGADSYPGAGNYYPGASGNGGPTPTPTFTNFFDIGAADYPGAGSYPGASGSGYPGATGPSYSPGAGTPGPGVSCPDSLNNANRAFDQLVGDLKKQAPKWSVFSDFDAVNEVSYFIKNSCNTTQLQLIRVGPPSGIPSEEEACDELQAMLQNLLEENNSSDFRGGFEGGVDTSSKGLELGKKIGDDCHFQLVQMNDANTTNATDTANTTDTTPTDTAAPDTTDIPPSDTVPIPVIEPKPESEPVELPGPDSIPENIPEPVPESVPEPALPPQDDVNTPPSLVRTSFRIVHSPVLNAVSGEGLGEEEETWADNGEWNNNGSFLMAVDDLEIWGYF